MKFFTDLINDLIEHYAYVIDRLSSKHYAYLEWNDPTPNLAWILAGIFVGIAVASVFAVYHKKTLGSFIRALLRTGAHDEASAKTLSELGVASLPGLRHSLTSRTSAVRKLVRYVGENNDVDDEAEDAAVVMRDKFDFAKTGFYIPDELKYRAEVRYDAKGTGWGTLVILLLCLFFGYFLLLEALPYFFDILNDLMAWSSNS